METVRARIQRQLPIAAHLVREKLLAEHHYDALVIAWSYEWRSAKIGEQFASPEGQRLNWVDLVYELDDCLFNGLGPDEPKEIAKAEAWYGPYNHAAMALAKKMNPNQYADLDAISRSVWNEHTTSWWEKAKSTIASYELMTNAAHEAHQNETDSKTNALTSNGASTGRVAHTTDEGRAQAARQVGADVKADHVAMEKRRAFTVAGLATLSVVIAGMWPFHALSGYEYNPEQALVVAAIWAGIFAWLAYKAPHHQLAYQQERDDATERRQRRNLAEAMRVDTSSLASTMFVLKETGLPTRGDLSFGHPSLDQGLRSAGLFEPGLVRALAAVIKEVAQTHASIVDYWGEVAEWENRNLAGHSAVESRDQPLRQKFIRVRATVTASYLEQLKKELAKELPDEQPQGQLIELPVIDDLGPIAKVGVHLGRQATSEQVITPAVGDLPADSPAARPGSSG